MIVRPINAASLAEWLDGWSQLSGLNYEIYQRLYVAITVDTTDVQAKKQYNVFRDEIYGRTEAAEQKLRERLLESGLTLSPSARRFR